LQEEFAESFGLADSVVLTDIYAAGETPIEGVHSKVLCDMIKARSPSKTITYVQKEHIVAHILSTLKPGDLVAMLGAGDIIKTCHELVSNLKGKSQA
jgi:UDP-N-acetylmuramate--alanine ligase